MSTEVVTTGRMKGGVLTTRNLKQFREDVGGLRDGEVIISVRRAHATRSTAQNAYYWARVVKMLADRIEGLNPDDVHDMLKAQFLSKKGAAVDGNGRIVAEFVIGGSTTRLNKIEFTDYLERICQWAAGPPLNLYIPPPDPNWRDAEDACEKCGELVPASSLREVEEEREDGGQRWTVTVKACRGCVPEDMRRAG